MAKTISSKRHRALIASLVEKREEAGLTQLDLARELGEYQSFVARLESGQRRVDLVEYLRLASILRFDPAEVLRKVQSVEE
jgi:transcriptional regulator with XRE-family HTH domain